MDEDHIRLAVRVTARLSAIAFMAALGVFAARSRTPPAPLAGAIRLLVAFIVLHTIHFGTVIALAVRTSGENIRERDGWLLTIAVAALFYLASFGTLRRWQRVASLGGSADGASASIGVLFIAAVFLNSYLARTATLPVYWVWMAAMVLSVAAYVARAGRWGRTS